jgi:lipoprotein-anchoring transpeptidase ErfK/SrfK
MKRKAIQACIALTTLLGVATVQNAASERASPQAGAPTKFSQNERTFALDPQFKRRTVSLETAEAPGTVIIETRKRFLYYILGGGKALRYKVGVARSAFRWSGTEHIARKAEWPDWRAPKDMLERRPDIPEFVPGGPGNPLGARALYLGATEYRIHGTPAPWTIGFADSSGCIRMTNDDVTDLYERVKIGTKVIVR